MIFKESKYGKGRGLGNALFESGIKERKRWEGQDN